MALSDPGTPTLIELRSLLDSHRPASVLQRLPGRSPGGAGITQAEALIDLDRPSEAFELLSGLVAGGLPAAQLAQALNLQAQVYIRSGWQDSAVLTALQAAEAAQEADERALALALCAAGYACKRCWGLSDRYLRDALELSPVNPRILVVQARIRLEADQRLEARSVYEHMAGLASPWAKPVAAWGLSYTAYLLGEFERAAGIAQSALEYSDQFIPPLFTLAQVALVRGQLPALQTVVGELRRRSPQAESLAWLQKEAALLQARQSDGAEGQKFRLAAFPTLAQRRNYCGPSSVELVLRYWKGSLEFNNDQIAAKMKYERGGTPIFRMREFFRLAGFDTIRCQAPLELLKKIVRAGFPVIIQQEFSNSAHVAVAIGYDESAGTVELQDPMTHAVTSLRREEFERLRQMFLDAVLIAFPHGRGHEKELARLNVFEDPALGWVDQAILELEQGRFDEANRLAERALKRHQSLPFGWLVRLHTALEAWRAAHAQRWPGDTPAPGEAALRDEFFALLHLARHRLSGQAELVHQFEGWGALLDGDYERALAAFQNACQVDAGDASNQAFLAECLYALRNYEAAAGAARRSLEIDPALLAGNLWMARCLAWQGRPAALHYARSAVDLDGESWQAHHALAEAALCAGDLLEARQANARAAGLAGALPEISLQQGLLLEQQGELRAAEKLLWGLAEPPHSLSPADEAVLLQSLARLAFNGGSFASALSQAQALSERYPVDPWPSQLMAAARAELLLSSAHTPQPDDLADLQALYSRALALNPGSLVVALDYLRYLEALAGPHAALEALAGLEGSLAEKGRLQACRARLLYRAGESEPAAQAMLLALGQAGGARDRDELAEAMQIILQGSGVEDGSRQILAAAGANIPASEIYRALGLALVDLQPAETAAAAALLRQVVEANPEDAEAALALGQVVQFEEDRESLYRRALLLAPDWPHARANLAAYLVQQGRPADALEYTRGHEAEDLELLVAHGRALQAAGHYEEAAAAFGNALRSVEEPDSDLFYGLWQAELHSGWLDQALKTARKALRLFPEEPRWYIYTAESLRSLQRFDEAEQAIRRGRSRGLSQASVLRAAYENAYARQDYAAALESIDAYLEAADEQRADGRLGWGEAARLRLLIEMGELEQALAFLDGEALGADGWGEAAWNASQASEPSLGLAFAGHALRLDPQNYAGLVTSAQSLADLGREDEAVKALYALQEAYPAEHHAYEKLAVRLALEGRMEQALVFGERGVELGPFCPFAWSARGLVYFLNGQVEDARHDLEIAFTRADIQERQKAREFWYLLSLLQGSQAQAESLRFELEHSDLTPLQTRLLAQIEAAF